MIGHAFADIELSNPRNPALTPIASRALADTGALVLCIPDHVAIQLELEMESKLEVAVADGRSMRVPYVGSVSLATDGCSTDCTPNRPRTRGR